MVSAAPMSGDWFHQHFGVGAEGLRITAWHGPNNQRSRRAGRPGEQLMDYGAIDLGKGGSAIPYHQEDPIREGSSACPRRCYLPHEPGIYQRARRRGGYGRRHVSLYLNGYPAPPSDVCGGIANIAIEAHGP